MVEGHKEKGVFHPHTSSSGKLSSSHVNNSKHESSVDIDDASILRDKKLPDNRMAIYVRGSKEDILKMIKDFGKFENIASDGWFSGYIYLDDGEGRTGYAIYRGKVDNNKIIVEMNKDDVPSKWRWMRDELLQDATTQVAYAVGIEM